MPSPASRISNEGTARALYLLGDGALVRGLAFDAFPSPTILPDEDEENKPESPIMDTFAERRGEMQS